MFSTAKTLSVVDPELWQHVESERHRQDEHIELIASENYTSPAVMQAQGSQLTNKYAEGYPGKRFYGGCEFVDQVEQIAIDRLKKLYGAEYANVQPHSGSQANQAVYFSILKPGDTVMGMNLGHGGHLTHGSPANLSGKLFNIVAYGLNENEEIDYDEMERIAIENKPKLLIGGASAYALRFDWARMAEIAKKVGAYFMVDMAHYSGLIAGGVYPNPVPHADFVTSTTHKTLRGPRGGIILAKAEHEKMLNSSVFPSLQGGPLMHVIAGKAVAFGEALQPSFKDYARQIKANAQAMAATFADLGLPIISGGTDNHLMLVDVGSIGISGRKAERVLDKVGISTNRNTIPGDTRSPMQASGLRIGTPAVTTRGFQESDCSLVAQFIERVLRAPDDEAVLSQVAVDVRELTAGFPVPGIDRATLD
jgi:glycine hydroxymethyltransferase